AGCWTRSARSAGEPPAAGRRSSSSVVRPAARVRRRERADCAARAHRGRLVRRRVELDDKGAAFEGVMHPHRFGYRRIGFVGGLPGASTSRRRLDGYRAARREAPLRSGARRRRRFPRGVRISGRARTVEAPPDAVFIANYLMTVGFMTALPQYPDALPGL